jgi:hypothetical protein
VLPSEPVVAFWLAVLLSDVVVVIISSGGMKPSDAVGVVSLALVICPLKVLGYRA